MKPKKQKPYWEMNAAELREATKEFDDPNYQPPALEWTEEDTALHERARRKPGRPRTGLGAKTVALSIERGLLDRADRLANKKGITRAELVAAALRGVLAGKIKLAATPGVPAKRRRRSAAA
jgi:hypothetical protein